MLDRIGANRFSGSNECSILSRQPLDQEMQQKYRRGIFLFKVVKCRHPRISAFGGQNENQFFKHKYKGIKGLKDKMSNIRHLN